MNFSSYIDHTLLRPDTSETEIGRLCEEAVQQGFASVCIPNYFLKFARRRLDALQGDHPKHRVFLGTVAGFPLGYATTAAKVEEIKRARNDGADEIDMVINIPAVTNANFNYLSQELDSCLMTARLNHLTFKLILENNLLPEDEHTFGRLCELCRQYEPDFVKTGTGYAGPVQLEHIQKLRQALPDSIGVKASGGIRTTEQMTALIEAGATRIGTSRALEMMVEA